MIRPPVSFFVQLCQGLVSFFSVIAFHAMKSVSYGEENCIFCHFYKEGKSMFK